MKVFLGGTVNGSKWRDRIIPLLKIDYFNPVIEEWNEDARLKEIEERKICDFSLYVLSPMMEGFYSLAEVTDDSFKKADKTVFCYLEEDEGRKFTEKQISDLKKIGRIVLANGGVWKHNLEDVIKFLNSSVEAPPSLEEKNDFKDVFISYGRRHSLSFARKLFYHLTEKKYKVWFDMNDIPLGVDFQEQIDEGIRKADNFVFVISPHSVNSIYCYKEIALAVKYNKRIIPILHIEPEGFEDKMHPEISKRNWIYARQEANFNINPDDWNEIDDQQKAFQDLINITQQHVEYVNLHTILLNKALNWVQKKKTHSLLLSGKERIKAQEWLLKREFFDQSGTKVQAPCLPIDLQANFIISSRKKAENYATDCFFSYARENRDDIDFIRKQLNLRGISSWSDVNDIPKGSKFKEAIERGVIEANSIIFFISPDSVNSKAALLELDYAFKYKKRIIPVVIKATELNSIPLKVRSLQFIDFPDLGNPESFKTPKENRDEKTPVVHALDELDKQLNEDKYYYLSHKNLLRQSIMWEKYQKQDSFLLQGKELEAAEAWLEVSNKKVYPATSSQKNLIETSRLKTGSLDTDVLLCYSKDNEDIGNLINEKLKLLGKITWNEYSYLSSETNIQQFFSEALNSVDNLIILLSKDFFHDERSTKIYELARESGIRTIAVEVEVETNKIVVSDKVERIPYSEDLDQTMLQCIQLLDTDKEYIRAFKNYARSAKTWEQQGKSNDLLLRGTEVEIGEKWLENANIAKKKPEPTTLLKEFISRSQSYYLHLIQKEKQQKRIKLLLIIVIILVLFASFFGVSAYTQYLKASKETLRAKKEAQMADSMKILANQRKDSADYLRKIAEKQKTLAEEQKIVAINQKQKAEIAKENADSARELAEIQRKRALFLAAAAKRNEYSANLAKEDAIAAEKKAHYYLYAFNSKNMAQEALTTQNKKLKIYLATTAINLNQIAKDLADEYNLNHPYSPVLLQSLQNAYMYSFNNKLTSNSTKTVLCTDTFVYSSTKAGYLAKYKIIKNNAGIKLDSITSYQLASNEIIYNIINVNNNIWINSAKGKVYLLKNDTLINKSGYFASGIKNISTLPTPGLIMSTDFRNNSKINDASRLGERSIFGKKYPEGREIEIKILQNFNPSYNWKKAGYKPNQIVSNDKRSTVFVNSGRASILYVDKNKVKEFPQAHSGLISALAISPDGNWLASGSYDGSIMIWNIKNLHRKNINNLIPIKHQNFDSKYITSLSFSGDNNFLLIADNLALKYIPLNKDFLIRYLSKTKISKKKKDKWWNYYKRGNISIERQ